MMNDYLTIENGAVTKCDPNVTNVVIPDGVTSIEIGRASCRERG